MKYNRSGCKEEKKRSSKEDRKFERRRNREREKKELQADSSIAQRLNNIIRRNSYLRRSKTTYLPIYGSK